MVFDEVAFRALIKQAVAEALSEAQLGRRPDDDGLPPNLTDAEVLARLRRGPAWLRLARHKGLLTSRKHGSRWLTSADEIRRIERDGIGSIGNGKRRGRPRKLSLVPPPAAAE